MSPLWTIPITLSVLLAMMLSLRIYQQKMNPHPEIVRKLLHVGMGLAVLPFPWVFSERWPVLVLTALAILTLLATRIVPSLHSRYGSVVSGVKRISWGEIYFPLSVGILFTLHENPLEYLIPVLILTLADAMAALIGISYGRLHYEATDGEKSAEGSLAFFMIAFFSVHVPLLLFTNVGRTETLLIAVIVGLLVMLMEAIAWRGLDNLFIPLGAYVILIRFLPLGVDDLLLRFAVTVSLVVFVMTMRHRSTLTHAALLGAALFGYAAFALGGIFWVVPPLMLFICHCFFWPKSSTNTSHHDVHVVIATAGPGFIWLFLYARYHRPEFLLAYTTCFCAHLAIIGISWLPHTKWSLQKTFLLASDILGGSLLMCLLLACAYMAQYFGFHHETIVALLNHPLPLLFWNMLAVCCVSLFFTLLLPWLIAPGTPRYRHVHRLGGLLASLASLAVFMATRNQ